MIFAFPSHDVTVTGYRLRYLSERLDQQRGLHLTLEDTRFANLCANQPFVTSLTVLALRVGLA